MEKKKIPGIEMSTPAIYEIKVKGKLSEQWADWFNGTLVNHEQVFEGQAVTSLICRVRDQAELVGIVKQLNTLNLPLISLKLESEKAEWEGGEEDEN